MRNENADNERKKHHRGRRRKKKGSMIANIILVIALIVFCVSGFQLFKIGKGYLDGRSEYDKVRKLAVTDDKNKNNKEKNNSEDGQAKPNLAICLRLANFFHVPLEFLLEGSCEVQCSPKDRNRLCNRKMLEEIGKVITSYMG